MVTTMPELLQPIPWLLHAYHGCYNQPKKQWLFQPSIGRFN